MTQEHAVVIKEFLEAQGHEVTLRPHYSGRFMYGRTTVGLVIRRAVFAEEAVEALNLDISLSSDNMGLDHIVY